MYAIYCLLCFTICRYAAIKHPEAKMRTDEEMEKLRERLQYVDPKQNEPVRGV